VISDKYINLMATGTINEWGYLKEICRELLLRRRQVEAAVEMRNAMMARTSRDKYSYVVHQENVKAFDEVMEEGAE
jgi:hypothetical protein